MRLSLGAFCLFIVFVSCETRDDKPERLAKQYCGSCHLFPSPSLLDKKTWTGPVMRQMAFRMGLPRLSEITQIPLTDLSIVQSAIPAHPLISEEDLQLITNYYSVHAPDSLVVPLTVVDERATVFNVIKVPALASESVTLLKFNEQDSSLYVGTRSAKLLKLDAKFNIIDSIRLDSPPSDLKFSTPGYHLTQMGIMDPNDQSAGQLITISGKFRSKNLLIDSLKRPVHFESADIDKDGYADFVTCNYGNYTGELAMYFGNSDATYDKTVLYPLAGSRKVVLSDFDRNGHVDVLALITQGDEKLSIFYNDGARKFRETILARFPPVYGFNYFELADFNGDGFTDIITTNGDNADYSIIVKPYHAIRIFENDGRNNFAEVWSYAMPGASQAAAIDFDSDGDLDIAAISFFPDERVKPNQSFVYLENKGGYNFKALAVPETGAGRWLVMDTGDFDNDQDTDIFLGSFYLKGVFPGAVEHAEGPSMLVLENHVAQ